MVSVVAASAPTPVGTPGVPVPGIDPTTEELNGIDTLGKALEWAGVDDDIWKAFNVNLGGAKLLREVAGMPPADWDTAMFNTTVPSEGSDGRPLKPVDRVRLGSVLRISRLKMGMTPGQAAQQPAPGAGTASLPAAMTPTASTLDLELSSVIDQSLKGKVSIMEPAAVRKMLAEYKRKRGAYPHPDCEPTVEQLSALDQILKADQVPYVDKAVWGPNGRRLLRKMLFIAFTLQPDGTWQKRELPGPPDVHVWWACWKVFRTAALLLDIADPEILDNYAEFIKGLAKRYPACWFIVYSGDVRMRSEHFERIRRAAEEEHTAGCTLPSQHLPYDPQRPWNSVFQRAIMDTAFWDEQVRENARDFIARDGAGAWKQSSAPQPRHESVDERPPKAPRLNTDIPKNSAPGSKHTQNKKGVTLCESYQHGSCSSAKAGGVGACPSDLAHQCHWCLGLHAGDQCWYRVEAVEEQKGKAGGKGKGGKGSKGSKGTKK